MSRLVKDCCGGSSRVGDSYPGSYPESFKMSTPDQQTIITGLAEDENDSLLDVGVASNFNYGKDMYKLCINGNISELKKALDSDGNKENVDLLDASRYSLLHYAIRYHHLNIAKMLMNSYEADVNIKGPDDLTPFHFACRYIRGSQIGRELAQEIFNKVLYPNIMDNQGMTGLHHAAMRNNIEAVDFLLAQPMIDPTLPDKQGRTALLLAIGEGNTSIVEKLIGLNSACYSHKCSDGQNVVHKAVMSGHLEVVELLQRDFQYYDLARQKDNHNLNTLHLALDRGSVSIIKLLIEDDKLQDLIEEPDRSGDYPIHSISRGNLTNIAELLIDKGVDVNVPNRMNQTPLHLAAESGNIETVKLLINHGADINKADKNDYTPIMLSALQGNKTVFRYLCGLHEIELDRIDSKFQNILHILVENNHPELLGCCFKHNTNELMHVKDINEETPLHIAARKGFVSCTQILLNNDDNDRSIVADKNDDNETPCHVAARHGNDSILRLILSREPSSVNQVDKYSNTPLHVASRHGNPKSMEVLLKFNSDAESFNSEKLNPMDCAAESGIVECVEILLKHGCYVDGRPNNLHASRFVFDTEKSTTPLHIASKRGHAEVVDLLLREGADVQVKDDDGFTAIQIAVEEKRENVLREIVQSKVWHQALRVVFSPKSGCSTAVPDTPMRAIIREFPDVAKIIFDKCVQLNPNDASEDSKDAKLTFNTEFLEDTYLIQPVPCLENEKHTSYEFGKQPCTAKTPYTNHSEIRIENHPLMLMVKNKRNELLRHPLSVALTKDKWSSFGRKIFLTKLLIYMFFLLSVTFYVELSLSEDAFELATNQTVQTKKAFKLYTAFNTTLTNTNDSKLKELFENFGLEALLNDETDVAKKYIEKVFDTYHATKDEDVENPSKLISVEEHKLMIDVIQEQFENTTFVINAYWFTVASIVICLIARTLQVIQVGGKYFYDFGSVFEIPIFISAIMIISRVPIHIPYWSNCYSDQCWKWPTGAFLLTCAWLNLLRYLKFFTFSGVFLLMFKKIMITVMKLSAMLALFVLAFALGFNLLLERQDPFSVFGWAYLKTIVMTTGEFEYDEIFNNVNLPYQKTTAVLFLMLVLMLTIVLMNMLIGIAVNNINEVQEEAKLEEVSTQVVLALDMEKQFIFNWMMKCFKREIKQTITIPANPEIKFKQININLTSIEPVQILYWDRRKRKSEEEGQQIDSLRQEVLENRKQIENLTNILNKKRD